MMRYTQTGAGERLTADQILRQAQFAANLTHLILEQVAQGLHQLLEVHSIGQAADIVVALDDGGFAAQAALHNVRIDGALCQEIHLADLLCLLLKDADELLADDLALALGLGNTGQLAEIAVAGIHTDEVDIKAVGIARAKDRADLFLLVLRSRP